LDDDVSYVCDCIRKFYDEKLFVEN